MKPHLHFLAGLAATLLAFPVYGYWSILIVATAVFMDVDHFMHYIWTKKSFDLKKAYNYYADIKDASDIFLMFHFVEWLGVMVLVSFYTPLAFLVLIGMLIHFIQDLYHDKFVQNTNRQMSFIGWLVGKNT